jgi:uncharacterized protein YjdB
VATVTVDPATATIGTCGGVQLTATVATAQGSPLFDRAIAWTSSNTAVAQVSANGAVTGVSAGTATITATSEGKSGSSLITVTAAPPPPVATVTVTPPSVSMGIGATSQLTATPRDANGVPLVGRVVTWNSSNNAVATVSPDGLVTGVSVGVVVITATSEGQSGTASAEVTGAPPPAPVASVTMSPSSVSIEVGATAQITATPRDAQGNPLAGRVVTWSSSNPSIASVSASGLITGVTVGNTTVTATSEGISGTVSVTVTPKPVVSVNISAGAGSVCVGASLQLSATPLDVNGNPLTGRVVVWSVNTGLLASINPSGLLVGLAIGSVTVTATVEGVSASLVLTICPPVVATVEISAPGLILGLLGLPMQLTAIAKDANGNVITGLPVTWSVSPSNRATVVGGLLVPLLLGNVTVTATIGGVQASIAISIQLL